MVDDVIFVVMSGNIITCNCERNDDLFLPFAQAMKIKIVRYVIFEFLSKNGCKKRIKTVNNILQNP